MGGDIAIAGQSEWHYPEADWLTIPQAPYYFSPAYVTAGADFFAYLVRRARAHSLSDVVQLSDHSVALHRGMVRLIIDGCAGDMWLEHRQSHCLTLDGSDVDYQSVFYAEATELETISPEHRQSVLDLANFAMRFRRDQQHHFLTALQQREAVIVGRWHSLTEPFRPVEYDQWLHFKFDPSTRAAKTGGDAILYSPMVMPIVQTSTAVQLTEGVPEPVLSWLIDQMRLAPDRPRSKKAMLSEARSRCTDLSERKFLHLWKTAISSSGAVAWGEAGRRK